MIVFLSFYDSLQVSSSGLTILSLRRLHISIHFELTRITRSWEHSSRYVGLYRKAALRTVLSFSDVQYLLHVTSYLSRMQLND